MLRTKLISRWKLYQKTRTLQLVHFLGFFLSFFFISVDWLAIGLITYCFFETFGGNIGLHRYLGHKSFQTNVVVDKVLVVIANLVGAGSSIAWVGVHRYHHVHSDTEKDVHSPYFQQLSTIILGNWDVKVPPSYVKDLLHLPLHRFFHKNYFMVHFLYGALLLFINFKVFLFCYCWPCFLCLMSGYLLAIGGHIHGYQTYKTPDQSRNSWLVNIYTLGEGWHNNHHQKPDQYYQGEKSWEWDLPGFIIHHFLIYEKK